MRHLFFQQAMGDRISSLRSRAVIAALLLTFGLLLHESAFAETCKLIMNGTTFTPPSKPQITRGTTAVIKVFGNWVDIAASATASKSGITIVRSNGQSGGMTPCNTNITLTITVPAATTAGEMTITLKGTGGTYTASFKVDVVSPPPPPPPLCGTASGVLSMMTATIVNGTPGAPGNIGNGVYQTTFTSNLFKVAQPEATNVSCNNYVALEVYMSTNSASLNNLSTLAANDNANPFTPPAGVVKIAVPKTRAGNTLTGTINFLRREMPAGTIFYKVAKRITGIPPDFDPYVFSSTFSFTVTNVAPIANAGTDKTVTLPTNSTTLTGSATDDTPNPRFAWTKTGGPAGGNISSPSSASTTITGLVVGVYTYRLTVTDSDGATSTDDVTVTVAAAPVAAGTPDLRADGVGRPIYGGPNGTVGDGTFTYFALPENFCLSLPDSNSYVNDGTLGAAFAGIPDRRIMRLDFPLPAMPIHYKNIGNAATGAGFNVQVLKCNSSTVLQTIPAPALAAGASGTVNFTGRGTAIVYRFPGFDGTDMRRCYVREELDHTFNPVFTKEKDGLQIFIDSGNVITTEPNESNNKKCVPAGTSVIIN